MTSQWYYAKGGEQHGPISGQELKELATSGGLGPADFVWKEGMPEWRPAGGLQGLFPEMQPRAVAPPKATIGKPIILNAPPISPPQTEGIGTSPTKQASLFEMAKSFSQKAIEGVTNVQVKVEAYRKEAQQQLARKSGQVELQPTGTLLEVLRIEVARYKGWSTPTGDWLAEKCQALVREVETTSAETPEQHRARMVVADQVDKQGR